MSRQHSVRKIVSMMSAVLLCAASLPAQNGVSAQPETALVLVSKIGIPTALHVEFGLSNPFAVSEAHLVFRERNATRFREVRLRRNQVLRYVADLPVTDDIEYYFLLKPERGPDVRLGSEEEPFLLTTAQLERKQSVASHTTTKIVVVGVVAVILTIGIVGIEKANKH